MVRWRVVEAVRRVCFKPCGYGVQELEAWASLMAASLAGVHDFSDFVMLRVVRLSAGPESLLRIARGISGY